MTAKRFTYDEFEDCIIDNVTGKTYWGLDDILNNKLNELHEEKESYKQKVHETLQKYMDEYMNKECTDLDPMVYASEVIDEIAEELGVELE